MMNFVITAETKEIMTALEEAGIKQELCERIMLKLNDEPNVDYDLLLDAVGRINAYADTTDEQSIRRLYYLMHTQNEKYNYGGLRQIGMTNIPDWLRNLTRYLSVALKENYLPEDESMDSTPAEKIEHIDSTAAEPTKVHFEVIGIATDDKELPLPDETSKESDDSDEVTKTPAASYAFIDSFLLCLNDEAIAYLKSKL